MQFGLLVRCYVVDGARPANVEVDVPTSSHCEMSKGLIVETSEICDGQYFFQEFSKIKNL